MSKRSTSMFLAMLIALVGMNAWGQESERLTFGVISDIHFDNGVGEGAMVKVPKALKNLTSQAQFDALAIVGDLADAGRADQYELLTSVFGDKTNFTNPIGDLLFMMGNHDHANGNGVANYQNGLSVFNGGEPYPMHQYKVIKGYPFITVSMLSSGGTSAYPDELKEQLDAWLTQATLECPGKPIFVFTHVPPQWSVYGSWPEFENGSTWGTNRLNSVLNKYPQVVMFSGHSHYPVGDPRSIHQGANPQSPRQNYYTVINTGSTTYSEVNPGVVAPGIHPENYAYVTEGLVVSELENGDIEIRRYDTYRNQEIGAQNRWVLKAPFDGSQFQYADIRDRDDNPNNVKLRDGLPAPAFTKSAEIKVEVSPFDATATIPQATDDECVFRYRIRLIRGGLVLTEKYIFSQFYLNSDTPNPISYYASNLNPETEYKLEVTAYDSYDNASTPLKVTFKTPVADAANMVPTPDGQWTFEDAANLMKPVQGGMTMQPCLVGSKSVTVVETLEEAGITATDGPSADNKAILVPKDAALKVLRTGQDIIGTYTLLMDVMVKDAGPYDCLFQTNMTNNNDGDLFIYQNKIGMGTMGGYFGEIKNETWHRIVLVYQDNRVYVYVDGELLIDHAGNARWELDPFFFLFCDEDGEMNDTKVAEVAYWEKGFNQNQVRALSGLDPIDDTEEPYLTVLTPVVKIADELEFTVRVDANVFFTFDLPEWIEPVDVTPYLGTKSYTFRAQPMETTGRREGIITVSGEGVDKQEVEVTQMFMGDDIPEALGVWTFDDPANLMDGGGSTSFIRAAFKGSEGPEVTNDPAVAGIVPVAGPTEENGAINVPADAYLWLTPNADNEVLADYTIMYDIKPSNLTGYKSLFQYDVTNKSDAGLFIKNNQIGRGGADTMIGYLGELQPDKWYRLLFVVKESRAILYLDGEYFGESAQPQDFWTITKEALLFADEDGEEGPVDVAGIRFWDFALSATHAKRLGDVYKEAEEYFSVLTSPIRLIDKTDFSITVNANVPFTFDLPEWVEPVDVEPVEGEKAYTFRAKEMEQAGRREATITVEAEYFTPKEIRLIQIKTDEEVPEATGTWTFDNPDDLMAGTGIATLSPAYEGEDGPVFTDNPEEAGIYPVDGPNEENGAISVPVETYLLLSTNLGLTELNDYSVLMDVKLESLAGYSALYQTNPTNKTDGSFFIKNGQIGLNNSGLGYHGSMEASKWHRIMLVVKDCYAYAYLDGERVGQSTTANNIWKMASEALFFADNNGEDGYKDVAEVRFWDVPLTDEHVKQLGTVEQDWQDDPMPDVVSVWTFDNANDLLAGTGVSTLQAAMKVDGKPQVTDDLAAAGIVPVAGPTSSNGAATVPIDSYLQLNHNLSGSQQYYTLMMDIRPKSLAGYNALLQTSALNNDDADIFLNKTHIGINTSGLGYGGEVVEGKWHRIVLSVFENCMSAYIDGKMAVTTFTSNTRWALPEVAYLFCDEDGEEGTVDIAELRFWDAALTGKHIKELGVVNVEDAIELTKETPAASSNGLYDMQGRKIVEGTKLQKGIYIMGGKKIMIK